MNKLKEISYEEMVRFGAAGTHGVHGSPVPPELLDTYKGAPEGSLMPLHAPRNYNRQTGLHAPRHGRLARVSFYGPAGALRGQAIGERILARAGARGLFHSTNHDTLPPNECLSGSDIGLDNELALRATAAVLEDTRHRGENITATLYAAPIQDLEPSPDQRYDYWSADPVQPEYFTRIDGTRLEYLASLCLSSQIEVIPPFEPNANNC